MDKRISMQHAVDLVGSSACLGLGGLTLYRRPVMFVRALVEKFIGSGYPDSLTLLAFTAGMESDLLVGAGMVARVRSCYFGLEIFGLAPMFTYYANRGEIDVQEETEASLAGGLRASLAGISFMPSRAWLGTDLPKLRPDVKTIIDPYNGEELMAFPAITPDISVIHALRADYHGNAQIGDNKGIDEELCLASTTVIITAEEIVPELTKADLVSPFVTGVVHAPGGALPTSCHPLYPLDGAAILAYTEKVSDPASYNEFLATWTMGF
jgi:glutaconate CoA-transferase subunit A